MHEKTVDGTVTGRFPASLLSLQGNMLFPAKPPTPEQQERNYYAAKEQQATDEIAAKSEAKLEDILRHNDRLRQERARQRRERGGYDDDYGRGREL